MRLIDVQIVLDVCIEAHLIQQGRREEAETMIGCLLRVANDLGLFAEEYDAKAGRMLGNYPQASTHVAAVNTLTNFSRAFGAEAPVCAATTAPQGDEGPSEGPRSGRRLAE